MNKTLSFLLSIVFILPCQVFAQANKLDSLEAIIRQSNADSTAVKALIEQAKALRVANPEKALEKSLEALSISTKANYTQGRALSFKWIGFYYFDRSNFDSTQYYWEKSLEAYREINDYDGISNMLNNIGSSTYNSGNNAIALDYFTKALEAGEKSGNKIRIITSTNNIGLIYMSKTRTYKQALVYLEKSLDLAEKMNDADNIGTAHANIGEVNMHFGNDSIAMSHFLQAKEAMGPDGTTLPYILLSIGRLYQKKKDYPMALNWYQQSFASAEKLNNTFFKSDAASGIAETYRLSGEQKKALLYYDMARKLADSAKASLQMKTAFKGLANTYRDMSNYKLAYQNEFAYSRLSDSLATFNIDSTQNKLELENKEKEIALLTATNTLKEQEIKRQKLVRNGFLAGFALVLTLIGILYRDYRLKIKTNKLLDQRKAEIESLLLNILPFEVAAELQSEGHSSPRYYESVSVMFTDFVSFSKIAESLTPQRIVEELNEFFTEMDEIIEKYNLEKIKTIGDSYMCAGGIPTANTTHPIDMVRAGLDIVDYLKKKNQARADIGMPKWEIRIGINTGSLVAGVVGKKKYAYDIWGNTVNIASRMESNGEPGMLNISSDTYELIKDQFECKYRGKIYAKNVGEIDMYFVMQEIPKSKNTFIRKAEEPVMANNDVIKDGNIEESGSLPDL
jgi:class 3 adenylate cyclase